tara:strand:- start:874 stop:1686 length:813 start_codon:yes stop_codon:yes gene_type:complete
MKHNKKRNTAFIYETLTHELTQAIIKKDSSRKQKVVAIIKQFFNKGSVLAEELQLYRVLLETKRLHAPVAERLLQETKASHQRLDHDNIFAAQSEAIAVINKNLGKTVWANFVPNFKSLASVNAIFSKNTPVKKKVLFEQSIVDGMSSKQSINETLHMAPIDNITYNSFIKKFNNKYEALLQEQKDLLNRYITSFADEGLELRAYLNEELARLKGKIGAAAETSDAPLLEEKLNSVLEYLEEFRKRDFSDEDLNKVLKTQELAQEVAIND